jgi:hypothetical protein
VWSVHFFLRDRRVHPAKLLMYWNDRTPMPESIMHMLADDPASLRFTISCVEKPEVVIDVIGHIFDTILSSTSQWSDYEKDVSDWHAAIAQLVPASPVNRWKSTSSTDAIARVNADFDRRTGVVGGSGTSTISLSVTHTRHAVATWKLCDVICIQNRAQTDLER